MTTLIFLLAGCAPDLALNVEGSALVPLGEDFRLEARPGVTWESLDPSVVTIDETGLISAVGLGTTQVHITHRDRVESIEVYTAELADEVVLFHSADVVSWTGEAGEEPVGSTIRVTLDGISAEEGDLLLARDDHQANGRVIDVDGSTYQLEIVPFPSFYEALDVTWTREDELVETAKGEFDLGPLKCESASDATLFEADITKDKLEWSIPSVTQTWKVDKKTVSPSTTIKVTASIGGELGAEVKLPTTWTGSLNCKGKLAEVPITLHPAVAKLLSINVPAGVGSAVEADVAGPDLSFVVEATASLEGEQGVVIMEGGLIEPLKEVQSEADASFAFDDLSIDEDSQAKGLIKAYVWTGFEAEVLTKEFELLTSSAGALQDVDVKTLTQQVAEGDYSSGYHAEVFWEIESGKDIGPLLTLFGASGGTLQYKPDGTTVAESPHGVFAADETSVELGEEVLFTLTFEESTYLGIPNIAEVVVYEVRDGALTEAALELFATEDELVWSGAWTPAQDDIGTTTFAASVESVLLPLVELEVADDSRVSVEVSSGDAECDLLVLSDRGGTTQLWAVSEDGSCSVLMDEPRADGGGWFADPNRYWFDGAEGLEIVDIEYEEERWELVQGHLEPATVRIDPEGGGLTYHAEDTIVVPLEGDGFDLWKSYWAAWSNTGRIVYRASNAEVHTIDDQGSEQPRSTGVRASGGLAVNGAGNTIAFVGFHIESDSHAFELGTMPIGGGGLDNVTWLTDDDQPKASPQFAGSSIVYLQGAWQDYSVTELPTLGTDPRLMVWDGATTRTLSEHDVQIEPCISPDNTRVAYTRLNGDRGAYEVWVVPIDGSSEPTRVSSETESARLASRDCWR